MLIIELKPEGRRIYIAGNSFPIKDDIKSAGGHWDGDRKQWWIGSGKLSEIESAIAKANESKPADGRCAEAPYSGEVWGKVLYKNRNYYVRWSGRTARGTDACRLVTLDGKLDFWADESACQWLKRYEKKGAYGKVDGRYGRYPTLSGIRSFVERRKADQASGVEVPLTRKDHEEIVDGLDQADDFQGAAAYARKHGISY